VLQKANKEICTFSSSSSFFFKLRGAAPFGTEKHKLELILIDQLEVGTRIGGTD